MKILWSVRVVPIIDKIEENRFRWFEYIKRIPVDFWIRIKSQITRGRERPKINFIKWMMAQQKYPNPI